MAEKAVGECVQFGLAGRSDEDFPRPCFVGAGG